MATTGPRRRSRGTVDQLPSGAYRVRVYAGVDPLTGKRHDLTEIVPPGPRAASEAEKLMSRLLTQLDERRNPRTKATVNQLMDRYLEVLDIEESSLSAYVSAIDTHVRPLLGSLALSRVDGEVLDAFYATLRRCRRHCDGRGRGVDHRTAKSHECDHRCRPHTCRPLAATSVRKVHWILSGAMERAVRWRWVALNATDFAQPPSQPPANPSPPSPQEAARILNEAWNDPDWGSLVWLAMTTGARRGELCGLRRRHLELSVAMLTVESSVRGTRSRTRHKDTKTHQKRRIALDSETVAVLEQHLNRQDELAQQLGLHISPDAFIFSRDPDCASPLVPDSVSQRFDRLATRLGIATTLHKLRHYNATELLAAGVDLRTVAGRLGHAGGGATTLRVYAAWVTEADQRAAETVAARLPRRPGC